MSNLFDIIKTNENKLIDQITAVYINMFEQMVSMYHYTFSKLYGDERERQIFAQQMRFIGMIKNLFFLDKKEEKVIFLLALVDKKLKTLEILEEVKRNTTLFSGTDLSQLERALEEHSILYSKPLTTHPFPFDAMFLLLQDPLPILQHFLMLPKPLLLIETIAKIHLEEKIGRNELLGIKKPPAQNSDALADLLSACFTSPKTPMNMCKVIQALNDHDLPLSKILSTCEKDKIEINKQQFTQDILNSINEVLIEWSQYFLKKLFPTQKQSLPVIDSLIRTDELENKGILYVDQHTLKKLCYLGQADRLGDMISRKLKSIYLAKSEDKNNILYNVPDQLPELTKWIKTCRMGYASGFTELPSIIATMLYTRINYAQSIQFILCSTNTLVDIPSKNKIENLQHLVTCVINNCLYFNNTASLPVKEKNLQLKDHFHEYISKSPDNSAKTLPNDMMKDWSVYDKKTTRNRFKRPLNSFEEDIRNVNNKINKQRQNSLQAYFPVRSGYPLPFWSIGLSTDE